MEPSQKRSCAATGALTVTGRTVPVVDSGADGERIVMPACHGSGVDRLTATQRGLPHEADHWGYA